LKIGNYVVFCGKRQTEEPREKPSEGYSRFHAMGRCKCGHKLKPPKNPSGFREQNPKQSPEPK